MYPGLTHKAQDFSQGFFDVEQHRDRIRHVLSGRMWNGFQMKAKRPASMKGSSCFFLCI